MPKRKKTRKEKLIADTRHAPIASPLYSVPEVVVNKTSKPIPQSQTQQTPITIATKEYSYLGKDLLKTGMFTGAVIAIELVLHFVSKGV